ncbi:hypothetical protein AAHZ94_18560 [Streptomyces sp. HSW2009]|uniref:hypothetical protein n=1 Tax=Streptomyces sp. HSW2009 TaxID=3142890 RepID=UPI0032EB5142
MNNRRHRLSSVLAVTTVTAVVALGTACNDDDDSTTPAPKSETKEDATPSHKAKEPKGKAERADLVRFELDDRSQAGITNIWVVWTVKNSSGEKSDYTWDWEAVDATGTRVENSSEFVSNVQPDQTATGEMPTTLKSTEGIKLNITSFNRTASF